MSAGREGAFGRRLENAVVARLQSGHRPEDLLAELKARLDHAAADAVLSRAEIRVERQRRSRGTGLTRVLMVFVYIWTGVLVLQNVGVLVSMLQLSPKYGLGPLLPT